MTTITTYASGRQQLPWLTGNITVNTGGSLGVSGTYYFTLQGRNLAGLNLASAIVSKSLTTTNKLNLTFPALASGEYWTDYVISASTTNTAASMVQIAKVRVADIVAGLELDGAQILQLTLLERTVANTAALPTSGLKYGIVRYVTSLGFYYEYNPYSTKTVDGLSVLTASVGRWLRVGTPSFVSNTSDSGGCDVDIRTPNLTVEAPSYGLDGSKGTGVTYWLRNDFSEAIPSGTRISGVVKLFDEDKSQLFDGLIVLESPGYVDLTTAILNTSAAIGEQYYSPNTTAFVLSEDLPSNSALALTVSPKFRPEHLQNQVPYLGIVSTFFTFSPLSGEYVGGSRVFGNLIYPELNRLRITPGIGLTVRKQSGSALITSYEIFNSPSETIGGLSANTANQYLYLTTNATAFISANPAIENAVIRAAIGTVNGVGIPVSYGSVALDSTKSLQVVITYNNLVRSDYPDTTIASFDTGILPPAEVNIYIKNASNNYFVATRTITPAASSDTFTLVNANFSSTALPAPATNYGLYKPTSVVPTAPTATSGFTSGTYEVLVAYKYSNNVTSIDHTAGNFTEAVATVAELFEVATSWGKAVVTNAALRAIPLNRLYAYQARYNAQLAGTFRFDPASVAADNATTVIKPTALGANPGAFVLVESSGGGSGTADFNLILTVDGEVLVDTNGNVMTL